MLKQWAWAKMKETGNIIKLLRLNSASGICDTQIGGEVETKVDQAMGPPWDTVDLES
jgi:hypothetical protein